MGERPELESWYRKTDEVLAEADSVLDALKQAVAHNAITEEEAEERITAYHYGQDRTVPDVAGRDL